MGSCASATCTQCDSCRKQNSGAPFRSRAQAGGLSTTQRQHLESEADQMAERFMASRPASAAKPFEGLRPRALSTVQGAPVQKKPLPTLSAPATLLMKEDTEEQASGNGATELKGEGSVEETAETNVGEPSGGAEAEEVLTKRADSQVAPVAFAPASSSGGSALPAAQQQEMGSFFGRDFSAVRIHDDSQSHRYTQGIGALAATRGSHIYFSNRVPADRYAPLLAHELTHVVQQNQAPRLGQGAGSGQGVQRQADHGEISRAPVGWQLYQETICAGKANEHASTQPRDFPDTYISQINVSLTNQRVTLDWTGPSVAEAEEIVQRVTGDGVINCSTGAGVSGQTSCNNEAHSRSSGSCCTPIGTFTLGAQSCVTPKLGLENFSGFQRAGVGFHYYHSVPSHPASHGCVRLHRGASKIIFDSARPNHTTVVVSGSYASSYSRYSSCD